MQGLTGTPNISVGTIASGALLSPMQKTVVEPLKRLPINILPASGDGAVGRLVDSLLLTRV